MKILGVIPARYASTRLPGKPLVMLGGKSMLARVYAQAAKAQHLAEIVVATDDERIAAHVRDFGGNVVMTRPDHPSGTDRCAEALALVGMDYEAVVNIQGDEPFLNPRQIDEVAEVFLQFPDTQIATLVKEITTHAELIDDKEAKAILSDAGEVLYMSRSAIPFLRNVPIEQWHTHQPYYKHIGIYGFAAAVLRAIPALPVAAIEQSEGLEQLRWLGHYRLRAGITDFETLAIDSPADITAAEAYLQQHPEMR